MKTEHRILALILTLVVILGCMPSWVLASDEVRPTDTGQEQVFLEPVIEAYEDLPQLDSGDEPLPVETEPNLGTWTDPETGEEYPILSSVEDIIPEEIFNDEEIVEDEPVEDEVAVEQIAEELPEDTSETTEENTEEDDTTNTEAEAEVEDINEEASTEIKMSDMRFHDLRHTYAVNSLKAGDDIKTLQENLGHATAAFTLSTYAHATPNMKTEGARRMNNFIHSVMSEA